MYGRSSRGGRREARANDGCGAWCGGETTALCRVPRFRVLTAVELEHAARFGETVLLEQPRCERVERALAEFVREPAGAALLDALVCGERGVGTESGEDRA